MAALLQLFFLFLITQTLAQQPSQVCLLVPPETDACYKEMQGTLLTDRAAQVSCLQKLLWNFEENNTMTDQDYATLMALVDTGQEAMQQGSRQRRPMASMYPRSGYRTRKEYRTLTRAERRRFHHALDQLYRDGTISMFARIHAMAAEKHHSGASFLPWHRVFLAYFEESLRRVDPSVSLPYWDYTMDNDMGNPVNSILWTTEYFGNGVGDVTSGPSAYWVTHQGRLQRDYGKFSRLMSKENLKQLLTRCRLHDISRPTARPRYDLERMHDGVNLWVGGDMSARSTTAYDFLFYLHHAYIDFVWEMFRRNQLRRCRVDPETDYPIYARGSHGPDEPMVAFTWMRNADGLANYWTQNWYGYADPPSCPNCCPRCSWPSPIYCNNRRRVCVSRSRRIFPRPEPRLGPDPVLMDTQIPQAIQDDFARDAAAESVIVPRMRGRLFDGPPNDGRTRFTALEDAFQVAVDLQRSADQFDTLTQADGTQTLESQGTKSLEAQKSVSVDAQRAGSLEARRTGSIKSQRTGSLEAQRSASSEAQRSGSRESQRIGSLEGQRSGSLEAQRSRSLEVQRTGSLEAQRSALLEAQRSGSLEAQRSGSLDAQRSGSLEAQRSGSLEAQRSALLEAQRSGSLEAQRSGSLDAQRSGSLEAQRSGSLEAQRSASLEAQRSGSLDAQRSGSLEAQRSGSLEAQRSASLEAQRSGSLDAQRSRSLEGQRIGSLEAQRSASLEAQRSRSLEAQRSGSLEAQRTGSLEAQRPGSFNVRRTGSMEAQRSGSLEAQNAGSLETEMTGSMSGGQTNRQARPQVQRFF